MKSKAYWPTIHQYNYTKPPWPTYHKHRDELSHANKSWIHIAVVYTKLNTIFWNFTPEQTVDYITGKLLLRHVYARVASVRHCPIFSRSDLSQKCLTSPIWPHWSAKPDKGILSTPAVHIRMPTSQLNTQHYCRKGSGITITCKTEPRPKMSITIMYCIIIHCVFSHSTTTFISSVNTVIKRYYMLLFHTKVLFSVSCIM